MIDVYTWPTPNGHKVHIMLEETGLEHKIIPVNIGRGDQFDPEFLKISPNNKMPAIVDHDGPSGKPFALFESGAILIYMAEKKGKFLPTDAEARYTALQWLMFQMGGVGPMFGQANHFRQYAEAEHEYATNRYTREAGRLYGVLDRRLSETQYLAGDEYSIADIATFPWTREPDRRGQDIADFPNVGRWLEELKQRPAVQKGVEVLAEYRRTGQITPEEREIMFGDAQYQRR